MLAMLPFSRPRLASTLAFSLFVASGLALGGCASVEPIETLLHRKWERAGLQERSVDLEAGRVVFWDSGPADTDRPPLLLLHGFGASTVWQWHGQVRALSRERRVIAPDLLWFGGSSSDATSFTIAQQAAAVLQLLDHLELDRVDVVGLSYGGFVAYELTTAHPERVRRLALVASPGPAATNEDRIALEARLGVDDLADVFVPSTPEQLQQLVDVAFRGRRHIPRGIRGAVLRELYAEHREAQRALLHTLIHEEGRGSSLAPLPRCLPMLVLWGEDDEVFPLALGQRLADREGATLQVIPRSGHALVVERPRRVSSALRDFLDAARPACPA
jgi:pimeloyl-ACP methyl ester carboxylesterase